uniref:hypothetical protein n=1 Tax=Okeania sp. SIO2F4 TaxID=2607790 RepID=UPI0025D69F36|nr:hypothetical protein [Okeania sp. SIO2F4]
MVGAIRIDAPTRYFLSFVVEILPETLPKTNNSVGIDLGIKTFATVGTLHKGVRTWSKN